MNPTSPTVRSDSSTRDVSVLGRLGISIYLPSACMALGQMVLLVVLPLFIVSRGGGPSLAALVFAMRGLGSVLANVPVGFAIARWGQKSLMLVGSGVMGCSALLIMATDSTWLIAFATLMFGAGMGTWLLARLAYITETVPSSQRGTALSGLAGLQRLGMLLGPVIAGLGIASVGYHVVFAAVSASAWVCVVCMRGCDGMCSDRVVVNPAAIVRLGTAVSGVVMLPVSKSMGLPAARVSAKSPVTSSPR